jgi:hypothetical protein
VTTDEFWGQGDATEAGDGLIACREAARSAALLLVLRLADAP